MNELQPNSHHSCVGISSRHPEPSQACSLTITLPGELITINQGSCLPAVLLGFTLLCQGLAHTVCAPYREEMLPAVGSISSSLVEST